MSKNQACSNIAKETLKKKKSVIKSKEGTWEKFAEMENLMDRHFCFVYFWLVIKPTEYRNGKYSAQFGFMQLALLSSAVA